MRVGTITTKEFQLGESRMRREKSAEHLKKQADKTRETFHKRISFLATLRLKLLIPWWHMHFPTRQLSIIFGNGTEFVRIDGRKVDFLDGCPVRVELSKDPVAHRAVTMREPALRELFQAIADVDDITNGHKEGCPDDLTIEPIKQRARRPRWEKYYGAQHYANDKCTP